MCVVRSPFFFFIFILLFFCVCSLFFIFYSFILLAAEVNHFTILSCILSVIRFPFSVFFVVVVVLRVAALRPRSRYTRNIAIHMVNNKKTCMKRRCRVQGELVASDASSASSASCLLNNTIYIVIRFISCDVWFYPFGFIQCNQFFYHFQFCVSLEKWWMPAQQQHRPAIVEWIVLFRCRRDREVEQWKTSLILLLCRISRRKH